MSHSDIKYSDIYSELFRYISDIKLVPIIRRRPPNVHSKYIILPVFFSGILLNRCLASSGSIIVGPNRELEVPVGNCSFSRLNNKIAIVMMSSSSSLKTL